MVIIIKNWQESFPENGMQCTIQKLESRRASFEQLQLDEGKKEKWCVVLVPASSEESAEDENDESRPVLHVKSLPWRATQISKVFKLLGDRAEKCKSK